MELLTHTLAFFLDAAPWLLLGLVAAGIIKAWVPEALMGRWLGGRGAAPVVKAALVGAPLPLCSCGVLPAALGVRRAGASKGATVSFLIATPETGVDSIAVSYALLGPFMAVVRPVAAVASAILAGLLVGREEEREEAAQANSATAPAGLLAANPSRAMGTAAPPPTAIPRPGGRVIPVGGAPVASSPPAEGGHPGPGLSAATTAPLRPAMPMMVAVPLVAEGSSAPVQAPTGGCGCSGGCGVAVADAGRTPETPWGRTRRGLGYAFSEIMDDLAPWLAGGLVAAGVVAALVPPQALAQWGGGAWAMVAMMAVGVPMYICATASTPLAAALLGAGVSPGAVLVFLLVGPATNMATLAVVRRELGPRAVVAYLLGICGGGVLFGLATDLLLAALQWPVSGGAWHGGEWLPGWLAWGSAALLTVTAIRPLRRRLAALVG